MQGMIIFNFYVRKRCNVTIFLKPKPKRGMLYTVTKNDEKDRFGEINEGLIRI